MYIPTWHNINTDLKATSVFLRHIQRGQYLFQDSFYQPVKTICIYPYGNKQSMRMLGNSSLRCWKRAITLTFQDQNLVLLTISKSLYGFKQARKFWGIPNSNLLGLTKNILVKYPSQKGQYLLQKEFDQTVKTFMQSFEEYLPFQNFLIKHSMS
jgi:hypothetical protein